MKELLEEYYGFIVESVLAIVLIAGVFEIIKVVIV